MVDRRYLKRNQKNLSNKHLRIQKCYKITALNSVNQMNNAEILGPHYFVFVLVVLILETDKLMLTQVCLKMSNHPAIKYLFINYYNVFLLPIRN